MTNFLRRSLCLGLLTITFIGCGNNQSKKTDLVAEDDFSIKTDSLRIRDPYIFVDRDEKAYYLQARDNGKFKVYKSKDLENWKDLGNSFIPDSTFWGKDDFWAPDMYKYKGKYYIFGTFSGVDKMRGTSILVSDKPEGPYTPLVNGPTTPKEWMALDGALYIDDDEQVWMLYCHEWLQIEDGAIVAQRMSDDLTKMVGEPIVLFTASTAPWSTTTSGEGKTGYVTDAPVIRKLDNGQLIMTWSSFKKDGNKYCIGQAYSRTGNLLGPWEQDPKPLNNDDGGHAMIFEDLDGNLRISYHSPNSGNETATIKRISIDDTGRITIL